MVHIAFYFFPTLPTLHVGDVGLRLRLFPTGRRLDKKKQEVAKPYQSKKKQQRIREMNAGDDWERLEKCQCGALPRTRRDVENEMDGCFS